MPSNPMFNRAGVSRRHFLGWAGAAGFGLSFGLHSCTNTSNSAREAAPAPATNTGTQDFAGQTLRVFIYSGAWEKAFRESFVPQFQTKTGATVIPDPGWWDSIPKLKASPPGQPAFDLVLTDATQGYPAIKEGLFQTIDMSRIPNKENLSPSVLNNWVYTDGYGITFPESVMTLAYNKELIDFTPTGWSDLLRDDVNGNLGLYNSFYMSLYTFAAMKVEQDGKPGTAAAEMDNNLAGVIAFAKENRDRVKYWWPTSTDMALNLSQKNCAIGNMHSPDMLIAMRQSPELAAIVPDADRAFVQLMWVIPTGTQQKELAEEAINFLMGEEMQMAFAQTGSMTSSLAVAQKVSTQDPLWKQVYPSTEDQLQQIGYYPYDAYFKDWDNIVATWDKEILRQAA
ncbi:ABC transporter substrate-binding protein [Leptolyngbya sp. AN02str]|uniref:ABC transporter substrate-binding protein n=1 Tax=Leptolyngbya sp. AN02str TaxID=3423363 RepID=UPI003D31E87B